MYGAVPPEIVAVKVIVCPASIAAEAGVREAYPSAELTTTPAGVVEDADEIAPSLTVAQ